MWCSCSFPPAVIASRARWDAPRCVSRVRRRTGRGRSLSGARRLHRSDGTPVNHHLGVSAFADYATVSRHSLVKVDKDLPLNEAALFGCAVLTGVGAVFNTATGAGRILGRGDRAGWGRPVLAAGRGRRRRPTDRGDGPFGPEAGLRP